MIRDADEFAQWESEWLRRNPGDLATRLRLHEAMCEHARSLGVFFRQDPLEGIEVVIRVARALNVRRRT